MGLFGKSPERNPKDLVLYMSVNDLDKLFNQVIRFR